MLIFSIKVRGLFMNVHRTSYLLIVCRKAPEATILKNTLGKRSLMPYPVFYYIAKEEDGWAMEPVHFY